MILITTPTGDIGARVLRHVLDARQDVRVILRDPAKLPEEIRSRIEVVEGSHSDPTTIERGLDGARAVFWLPPGNPTAPSAQDGYVAFSRAFALALPSSGVTHVVGISALGRGWPHPAGLVTATLETDDMIGATGVNYRALCCASLMDNMLRQVGVIRGGGAFYAPTPGDLSLPQVAKADVANVAAALLTERTWSGVEAVPLRGPEDITHVEMARMMTEVLGKPIRFEEMPMEQFEVMLAGMGTSPGMVRDYVAMMRAKNEGIDTMAKPDDARQRRTPTTFQQWCERELKPVI